MPVPWSNMSLANSSRKNLMYFSMADAISRSSEREGKTSTVALPPVFLAFREFRNFLLVKLFAEDGSQNNRAFWHHLFHRDIDTLGKTLIISMPCLSIISSSRLSIVMHSNRTWSQSHQVKWAPFCHEAYTSAYLLFGVLLICMYCICWWVPITVLVHICMHS